MQCIVMYRPSRNENRKKNQQKIDRNTEFQVKARIGTILLQKEKKRKRTILI